jgi:N,N'-diacetyllegionaminate synthase
MPADPASALPAGRFELGGRVVGGGRALVVAEIGQAHDGSLGLAHAFVDAVAHAGADALKFQTHIAAAESSPSEPWRVRFSPQDATRYDYWRRMEFTEEQWVALRKHADERGLSFISSPFSDEAVDLLARVGVAAWKVASGEAGNLPLLDHMSATRLPFLVSTGMSPLAETDAAVARVRAAGLPCAVLQCSSTYPCPPEKLGLNMLDVYRARYGCPVGLSDHSGTIYAALAAATLGCDLVEVHVTLSREMFGPDVTSSVTTAELRTLVDGLRFIERARASPVDKDAAARDAEPMRRLFTKSVVARVDLPSGTVLGPEHLALRKPGTGIPPARLNEMAGRKLRRAVTGGTLLAWEDLE